MRKRDYHGAAGAAIDREVRLANRQGREVELDDDQLEELGHKKRPLLRVIRDMCLRCVCGSSSEIRRCTSVACPLYPYRLGKDPYSTRRGRSASDLALARARISEQRADFSPEAADGAEAAE